MNLLNRAVSAGDEAAPLCASGVVEKAPLCSSVLLLRSELKWAYCVLEQSNVSVLRLRPINIYFVCCVKNT